MNNTTNSWEDREAFWLTIYKYVKVEDRPAIRKLIIPLLHDTKIAAREELIEQHKEAMIATYTWLNREVEKVARALEPTQKHLEWFFAPENKEKRDKDLSSLTKE